MDRLTENALHNIMGLQGDVKSPNDRLPATEQGEKGTREGNIIHGRDMPLGSTEDQQTGQNSLTLPT